MRAVSTASKMAALLDKPTAAQTAASMVHQMAALWAVQMVAEMVDLKVSSKEYYLVVYSAACWVVL